MTDNGGFEGWAILELMGHRKLGGRVSEQEVAGVALLRIDVPGAAGDIATQFYSPSALYCLTPTSEEIARAVASRYEPAPVTRWELRALEATHSTPGDGDDDDPITELDAELDDRPW